MVHNGSPIIINAVLNVTKDSITAAKIRNKPVEVF
jgi:hypothetical protein